MRRTIFGLTGVVLLLLTVAGVMTQRIQPAHHHGTATAVAATPFGAVPGRSAVDAAAQPATVLAKVSTPVPASTQLVSPKAGAPFLVFWFDPAQPVIGEIAATTWGGPTFRPVVSTRGNWLQIRLDSRPNGATGWVQKQDVNVTTTPDRIIISVSQRNLTLYKNGWPVASAPVGVGRPQWPTPVGPSFVDAIVSVPARQQYIYGPTVLITGTHSNVFTEFDGGDGTVGIHGYPSDPASTAGVASSHGCIRANPQIMAALAQVHIGSPIDITA